MSGAFDRDEVLLPGPVTHPAPAPEEPPTSRAAQKDELERQRYRGLEVFKDNIEAFTVALIMALVIKHFCVEAFKIPTSSMKPTLLGENIAPTGIGDRILVDKWAYLFQDPKRWDVIVFRYPLNHAKHFIKRVGGVGGEWIRISRGDIWTRKSEDEPWRIATKPRRARDELYLPVYPPDVPSEEERTPYDGWEEPAGYWEKSPTWRIEDYDHLMFLGGPSAKLELLRRIGPESHDGETRIELGRSGIVLDARFRMNVKPSGKGVLTLRWRTAEDAVCELRLAPAEEAEGSSLSTKRGDLELVLDIPRSLVPNKTQAIELEYVDGQVWAHIDGQTYGPLDEQREHGPTREIKDHTQAFELEARGTALTITDFRVDRDLHYIPRDMPDLGEDGDGIQIPEDHYFMLGDNTTGSSDSRLWELKILHLADGSTVKHEDDSKENRVQYLEDGMRSVVDQKGVVRHWRASDVDRRSGERVPFVERKLIVGRAFFIFWPVWPEFPGRAGFIH